MSTLKGKSKENKEVTVAKTWTQEERERHEYKMNRTRAILEKAWDNDEECRVISVNFKTGQVISAHNESDLSGFEAQKPLLTNSFGKSKRRRKRSTKAA